MSLPNQADAREWKVRRIGREQLLMGPVAVDGELVVPTAEVDRWKQQSWDDAQEIMRLRGALAEVYEYLRGGPDYHNDIGRACGTDACIVCLAEAVAYAFKDPEEGTA